MGGFEGGDEAGFWEDGGLKDLNSHDQIKKESSPYKRHIGHDNDGFFIQLIDHNDIRVGSLRFSTGSGVKISEFKRANLNSFLYKAYQEVISFTADIDIKDFFEEYRVIINEEYKNDEQAFLSISTAGFILLCKEACNLVLTPIELSEIAQSVHESVFVDLQRLL